MSDHETADKVRSLSDAGLHNMLTGLTLQTPVSSPAPSVSLTVNSNTDAPTISAASVEHIGVQPQSSLFSTPNRSIFSSGPPTSSLSVNTAQASMTGTISASASRPFAALTGPSSGTARSRWMSSGRNGSPDSSRVGHSSFVGAEKDIDDPTTSTELSYLFSSCTNSTPTTLARLFAATTAPTPSRQSSYNQSLEYTRALSETTSLPDHLYTRGFCDGRHSDIIVHAFSASYPLHRLLLDRSPFFSSALSGPWLESTAKEITLYPEEVDSNISRAAFELALKRLYGHVDPMEERQVAAGILATGCWLEMADLIESGVEHLYQQMSVATLASLIELVTSNYYGKQGDRLLASAKAMLYREGWQMPLEYWDGISGEMIRHIVGGDGFFVPGEWERWVLAKKLLNRRLKSRLIESGILNSQGQKCTSRLTARFSSFSDPAVDHGSKSPQTRSFAPEEEVPSESIYAQPEIAAILSLLEHHIHYMHLTFEQLQYIRGQVDILGNIIVRPETIMTALWMSTELRQKILNAPEETVELGIAQVVPEALQASEGTAKTSFSSESQTPIESCGVWPSNGTHDTATSPSGDLDPGADLRRFLVPSADSTEIIGGKFGTNIKTAIRRVPSVTNLPLPSRHEVASSPFLTHLRDEKKSLKASMKTRSVPKPTSEVSFPHEYYSRFPPCRFAVEFPNPRSLKEEKRTYSRTVWYAGSVWNIYIQKLRSSKKVELGVYLHRVRDREGEDFPGRSFGPRSVDEAIGQLEREMLMRRHKRRVCRQHQSEYHHDTGEEQSNSSGDNNAANPYAFKTRGGLSRLLSAHKTPQVPTTRYSSSKVELPPLSFTEDGDSDDDQEEELEALKKRIGANVPALPPYEDPRSAIKTYFKIYQMSPQGKSLSVHKSAPDLFNFSQSWGWRSVLDDSMFGKGNSEGGRSSHRDDQLRFSVVLGNI